MKIVLIVAGAVTGTLLVIFFAACIAVVRVGECMRNMERFINGDFRS